MIASSLDQPSPTGGAGDCWAELIGIVSTDWSEFEGLLPLMRERRALGIQRYGQPLRRGDGRDERRDALEEALDLAVYLVRLGKLAHAGVALRIAVDLVEMGEPS